MADIRPFTALRYDPKLVPASQAVTQPYDKISPAMQDAYYAAGPYNLVRIILGRRNDADNTADNVYTRAAATFKEWRQKGVLRPDPAPSIYVYSQSFLVPGTTVKQERIGFVALGRIEDYSAKVVFRHEQTLAKPKADRLDLLRATRAHFEQLFLLYEDAGEIDSLLAPAMQSAPATEVTDEYGVLHRMWTLSDPKAIETLRRLMRDKKLIIADGHHRYETAVTYRNERRAAKPGEGADAPYEFAPLTYFNLNGEGMVILPTHRVVHTLESFSADEFKKASAQFFEVEELDGKRDAASAATALEKAGRTGTALLAVTADRAFLLTKPKNSPAAITALSPRQQELDVVQLHKVILEGVMKLSEESIRNQQNLAYIRDTGEALARVRTGGANITFLMNPCRVQQVRDIAFADEVMPQKSTDFFPKLMSGLTTYALE